MPPVGPLCSAGVTPLHRYYGPIRQALAFTKLRLLGSLGYLASVVFLHGARSPSLFQTHVLVRVPPLLYSAGRSSSQVAFELTCCLRRNCGGSATRSLSSRSLDRAFTHRCGPRTRLPRQAGLCRWASPEGISHTGCHPSYAAATFYRFRTFTLRIHGLLQASHNYPGTGGTPSSSSSRARSSPGSGRRFRDHWTRLSRRGTTRAAAHRPGDPRSHPQDVAGQPRLGVTAHP